MPLMCCSRPFWNHVNGMKLLRQKLVPQLGAEAWLVVAVVGGTNIGKSVVFNHLAGCRASASESTGFGDKTSGLSRTKRVH